MRELVLRFAKLNYNSAAALVSALTSGALSKLQRIVLQLTSLGDSIEGDGDDTDVNVLNAVASSCPDLRHLYVSYMRNVCEQACEQAGTAIFDALRDGKWPKLEKLEIKRHKTPDEWGLRLAAILEGGAGGNLRRLALYDVPDAIVRELGRVLHEGACPKLRSLGVYVLPVGAVTYEATDCIKEVRALLRERGIRVNHD